ncbi:MAG: N5,N10-methylene tetrahydromethanopterin reductase [Rhodoglobus sp.]|nr:N5,N10-methylene tetrahydromethanopterin reductase [Rhodoglobus sp.]
MDLRRVSIGLPGATAHESLRELAPRIEAAGFRGLWLNDTPGGDSLAGVEVAAAVTTTLALGTGVIPLDRRPASEIVARLDGLPVHRLTIGIGSGGPDQALARVAGAIDILRAHAPVLVGALGPKMRRLAAERAGGVLLNWLTPATAAAAVDDLRRDATGRPVRAVLYARTIVAPEALPALEAEAAGYQSSGSYAANFERLGIRAIDATIDGSAPGALVTRAGEYLESVDELVLRVVTGSTALGSYLRFIEAVVAA